MAKNPTYNVEIFCKKSLIYLDAIDGEIEEGEDGSITGLFRIIPKRKPIVCTFLPTEIATISRSEVGARIELNRSRVSVYWLENITGWEVLEHKINITKADGYVDTYDTTVFDLEFYPVVEDSTTKSPARIAAGKKLGALAAKRGRGPAKPVAEEEVKRGRGRPARPVEEAEVKRGRGRPARAAAVEEVAEVENWAEDVYGED